MTMLKAAKRPTKRTPKKTPLRPASKSGGKNGPLDVWANVHGEEYIAPWLVAWLLLPLLGLACRSFWGAGALPNAIVGALGAGLTWIIWMEAAPRYEWIRKRAAATVGWVTISIVGTCVASGPADLSWWRMTADWTFCLYVFGGGLALWWTMASHPAVKGDGTDDHNQPDMLAEALNLGKSRPLPGTIKDDKHRRTFRLKLDGATIDAARQSTDLMEVKAEAPPGGIRIVQDNPDDASDVQVVVMKEDVLKNTIPYPGPSHPGGSITEPVHLGLREDGSILEDTLLENHRLKGGITGAGKTEGQMTDLAEAMTRRDVCLLYMDIAKPGQTVPDIAPALARVATTPTEAKRLALGLLGAITYRSSVIGGRKWTPGCGLPAVYVTVDEAAWLAELLGVELFKLVSTMRSLGMFMDLIMQRPAHDILDTNTRAQFTVGEAYGVRDDRDADMILKQQTIDAGANPARWGKAFPGKCYRECGPEEKWAMPARRYLLTPEELRAHVSQWAHRMVPLDAGTAEALGAGWTQVRSGGEYALARGWTRHADTGAWIPPKRAPSEGLILPAPRKAPSAPTPPTEAEDPEEIDMHSARDTARQEVRDEMDALYGIDPEAEADVADAMSTPDDAIPDVAPEDDFELAPATPGPELSREERVTALAKILEDRLGARLPQDLDDEDDPGVTLETKTLVNDWYSVPGLSGKQRPALYRLLDGLSAAGEARREARGRWWFADGAPLWLRSNLLEAAALDDQDEPEDEPGQGEQPAETEPPESLD